MALGRLFGSKYEFKVIQLESKFVGVPSHHMESTIAWVSVLVLQGMFSTAITSLGCSKRFMTCYDKALHGSNPASVESLRQTNDDTTEKTTFQIFQIFKSIYHMSVSTGESSALRKLRGSVRNTREFCFFEFFECLVWKCSQMKEH